MEALVRLKERLVAGLDPDETIEAGADLVGAGRRPDLRGHLLDLETVERIDSSTKVQRRQIEYDLTTAEGEVRLSFHGKTMRLPAHVLPQLQFVGESGSFVAADLPGDLDYPGRIVLISELLREGFLTLA